MSGKWDGLEVKIGGKSEQKTMERKKYKELGRRVEMISNKRKAGIILVMAILIMPIPIEADAAMVVKDLSGYEIRTKASEEGWYIDYITVDTLKTDFGMWDTQHFSPTVNKPSTLTIWVRYSLCKDKEIEKDCFHFGYFNWRGYVTNERVYLKIYKDDVLVDEHRQLSGSGGKVNFTVIFREPGYYAYKVYTDWESVNERIPEATYKFYVKQEPTPTAVPATLIPVAPTATPTVKPATTPTSVPITAIPAFQIIPAVVALLAVAYLLRRRN